MTVQIRSSNTAVDQLSPLKGKTSVRVKAGDQFQIVDLVTGLTPSDLVARRLNGILIVDIPSQRISTDLIDKLLIQQGITVI